MTPFSHCYGRSGSLGRGWLGSGWLGLAARGGMRLAAAGLLCGGLFGCLPARSPGDVPISEEPSEMEILRAENAELSRRVHELRAEKAELKRRLAMLELEEAPAEGEAAAAPGEAASDGPSGKEPSDQGPVDQPASDQATSEEVSTKVVSAAAVVAREQPVLISGSADAKDFDLGRQAFEAGSYQSADVTLTRFLAQNPRHPFADDALVLRGRARVGRRQFAAAERDFRQVAERYPEELVAPEAWLELVRLLQARGDEPGARQASHALRSRYPDSVAASLVPSELVP